MQALNARRGQCKGKLTRIEKFAEELGPTTTEEAIEARLEKLEIVYEDFDKLQLEYDALVDDADFEDQNQEIEDFETKYFDTKAALLRVLKNRVSPVTSSPTVGAANSHHTQDNDLSIQILNRLAEQQTSFFERLANKEEKKETKLPVIKVPFFSGDYKEWISFRDLYKTLVHDNTSLNNAQKFQYLKGYLKDEAAKLLTNIQVSDAGYEEAWSKLCDRYEKNHQIVKSFIESFFALPAVNVPSANGLRKLTDSADEILRGLHSLNNYADSRDPWIIHVVLQKIDYDSKKKWAEFQVNNPDPTWKEFYEFLEKQCFALQGVSHFTENKSTFFKKPFQAKGFSSTVQVNNNSKINCPKCRGQHFLYQCQTFIAMTVPTRRSFVKDKKLCFNCLKGLHTANKCPSKSRCKHCNTQHHTLVHPSTENTQSFHSLNNENSVDAQETSSSEQNNESQSRRSFVNYHLSSLQSNSTNISVLLPTAIAKVKDAAGCFQNVRILLDSGSQVSFITEACVQRLGVSRKNARIAISGISSAGAGVTRGKVQITLCSLFNSKNITLETFVLPKITSELPNISFDVTKLPYVSQLNLADPEFNVSKPIDILLGADKFFEIFETGRIQKQPNDPVAQLTIFGWIVAGEIKVSNNNENVVQSFHSCIDIDQTLRKFWELEEMSDQNLLTHDEQQVETHFQNTYTRSPDGKYIVSLPFKDNNFDFSYSYNNAIIRLLGMERRFSKNAELFSTYSEFLKEYAMLGHMKKIPQNEISVKHSYYLPHHAVLKAHSTTTKLRVVFDGSCKAKGGNSLNEKLLPGPCILKDLFSICLRFRKYKYAFSADIEKMFRQILISEADQDFQRIVWRESANSPIEHFRLKTVTYGTTSAPFHANRVLKQLAIDYETKYPLAARIVHQDFYMDDVMSGADSTTEILEIKDQLLNLLKAGGFNLRKWVSNSWPLIQSLPEEMREFSPVEFEDENKNVKVLGLRWFPSSDHFSYTVNLSDDSKLTKRKILSDASKLFDPLGFLAPTIIMAKSLIQLLWLHNLDWDDEVPISTQQKWLSIKNEFKLLEEIKIPRFIGSLLQNFEFHGFCDASEMAYSAVIYCRSVHSNGKVNVSIVAAKSKVAPIKQLSIPRLELCGALLLSKLFVTVFDAFNLDKTLFTAWTDSNIVLNWLSSHPRRWKTFVANRVATILETIPRKNWRHVRSECNPADCASRGLLPSELCKFGLWFNGPDWLKQDPSEWPKDLTATSSSDQNLVETEQKNKTAEVLIANIDTNNNLLETLFEKYSSWSKLYRIIAYCLRFSNNCKTKNQIASENFKPKIKIIGCLKTFELVNAKNILICWSQHQSFSDEIKSLKAKKNISSSSKILNLSPFLDKYGVLRVGGRIENSSLSYSIRHPIILSKQHVLAALLINYSHTKYLHAGVAHLFPLIRQSYWIVGARNLIRSCVNKCVPCFRQRQTTMSQYMSNLPSTRVQNDHPFMKTGVDYAGPITLRLSRGRNPKFVKAYICNFVCFVTKAMHIELVGDLTSDAFLNALKRFFSRRGKCADIFSDNGTTFHGARRKLDELQELFHSQNFNNKIEESLAEESIRWHFIPPAAPNMGGLWEAGVKSIKLHLKRVIGNQILTYEEMYTVLTQIESILNSRPLFSCSDTESNYLSPSHFLIGRLYSAIPEPDYTNINVSRLSLLQLQQNMVRGFWNRWHKEYLTTLQQRPKWGMLQPNVTVGQVAVIKDSNMPPAKWKLGKIIVCHPGSDNLVRVVTLKTKDGELVRPVTKIAVLPTS